MARYASLADLRRAFEAGELDDDTPLIIDNDSVHVSTDGTFPGLVFDLHPAAVLREALDLLDLPHQEA